MTPSATVEPEMNGVGKTVVNGQQNGSSPIEDSQLETTFLIVGAGPAGASLACFLGSHGTNLIHLGLVQVLTEVIRTRRYHDRLQ